MAKRCQRCVIAKAVVSKRIKIKGSWRSQDLCNLCMRMYQSEGKTEDKRN